MIRPRGGDFLYSDVEFSVMKREIELFKKHEADGFVFGILNRLVQPPKRILRALVLLVEFFIF